jgi:hypothetical protein
MGHQKISDLNASTSKELCNVLFQVWSILNWMKGLVGVVHNVPLHRPLEIRCYASEESVLVKIQVVFNDLCHLPPLYGG